MTECYKFKNFEILQFDFSDSDLVNRSIDLLNSNSIIKKHSLKLWKWRFDDNPIAKSYGLYAKEIISGDLAAILMFWPCKFNQGNAEFLFYQAINGIVNKKYQNNGIFIELNKIAIKHFSENNIRLFGIPNAKSYPTYNKLGWQLLEKLNPFYIPLSPIKSILNLYKKENHQDGFNLEIHPIKPFKFLPDQENLLQTYWTEELIIWRFIKHPEFNYHLFQYSNCNIIYKLKKRGNFLEAQIILTNAIIYEAFNEFKKLLIKYKVDVISYYGLNTGLSKIIDNTVFKFKYNKGLYLVINNPQKDHSVFINIEMSNLDTT